MVKRYTKSIMKQHGTSTNDLIYLHLTLIKDKSQFVVILTQISLLTVDEDIEPPRSRPKPTTTPIPTTVLSMI